MDANQTSFHLLFGLPDWASCSLPDESKIFAADSPVAWSAERHELTLRPELFHFPAALRDEPPRQEARRGAAADLQSNWYWIGQGRDEIRTRGTGQQSPVHFWSATDAATRPVSKQTFQPASAPAAPCARTFSGLAVTDDQYLVVGTEDPGGLLIFDLLGGGAPQVVCWPAQISFRPFDIVPRPGGGVWILDRDNKRFWGLDRTLRVITHDQAQRTVSVPEEEVFQPESAAHPARVARTFPEGIDLEHGSPVQAVDPVAIEAMPDGSVLILDAPANGPSRVLRCRFGELLGEAPLDFAAYDFAFADGRLVIASAEGNQAFAFTVTDPPAPFALALVEEYFPMRRFGGKALVASGTRVYYDFGDRWLPLIAQPHPRHVEDGTILTRIFDGREPQCTWHRLMLDACLPAGTAVEVSSRAADSETELLSTQWDAEPRLHRRREGSELPFVPPPESTDRGTFEVLLQKARGRFLQLRLHLVGDGRLTPRLTRLRVYYPRFSYLRYLPAVYREDPVSASFLDRFLANFEGTNTAIEDRIAAVQLLFDVRSAPPDALEWLASWFGAVLDPAWDETRRRLFIAHAMEFFQWRGTVRGLKMALRLTLEEQVDDHIFDPPGSACRCGDRYRIIEKFLTRESSPAALGDPTEASTGLQMVTEGTPWKPEQGAEPLHARYSETGEKFPLTPIANDANAEAARVAFAQRELGFVPSDPTEEIAAWRSELPDPEAEVPNDEPAATEIERAWRAYQVSSEAQPYGQQRRLWQQFLIRRYVSLAALNQAHATHWGAFETVAYPTAVPTSVARLTDWVEFETHVLPTLAAAHRFTVLLPVKSTAAASEANRRRDLALASRIVDLEKPAHTAFDIKFFWANFRLGEARLGADTVLGLGGRDPALLPRNTVLGESYLSESLVASGPPPSFPGRIVLGRDRLKRTNTKHP
jgi:phage tail-like protein